MQTGQSPIFLKSKEEAMPHVLSWLGRTYEERRGSMLLKKDVHAAYAAFCAENRFEMTTNAAFGKLFKRVFPTAEVRRLVKHNETTFFYENMSTKDPRPLSDSTESVMRVRSASPIEQGSPIITEGAPSSTSRSLQYRIKKMSLSPSSASPTPTTGLKRVKDEDECNTPRSRAKKSPRSSEEGLKNTLSYDSSETIPTRQRIEQTSNMNSQSGEALMWRRHAQLSSSDTLSRFIDLYRTELWGLWPINPAVLVYSSLSPIFNTEAGITERSALSVNAHFVVTMGYLMLGDVTHAREYFFKTREHLSHVFDSSNYDVAWILKHMAWAAVFFCSSAQEGYDKEMYYLAVCKNMCQVLGAFNDSVYLGALKRLLIRGQAPTYEHDAQHAVHSPPFRNNWADQCVAAGLMQYHELSTYQLLERQKNIASLAEASRHGGYGMNIDTLYQSLTRELNEIRRLEDSFHEIFRGQPPQRLNALNGAYILVFRVILHLHLNNQDAAVQNLTSLIQHLARMEAALIAIAISELASSRLFSRELLTLLLHHDLRNHVHTLMHIMHPLRRHFFWIDAELGMIERAISDPQPAPDRYKTPRPATYPPSLPPPSSYTLPHLSALPLAPEVPSLHTSLPVSLGYPSRTQHPMVGISRSFSPPPHDHPLSSSSLPPEFRFEVPFQNDEGGYPQSGGNSTDSQPPLEVSEHKAP